MAATTDEAPRAEQMERRDPTRTLRLAIGVVLILLALALLVGGGVALWGVNQRDDNGYFTTTSHRLSTPSYAFASASLDIGPDTPAGIGDFAKIRIQAASGQPVFVGIGPRDDVARYLARVDHSVITDFDTDPWIVTAHRVAGTATPPPPARQTFWRVQASGSGTQTISWPLEKGSWSAVVMNADGSRHVSSTVRIGARVPALEWIAIGLLIGGGLLLIGGASLIHLEARRKRGAFG